MNNFSRIHNIRIKFDRLLNKRFFDSYKMDKKISEPAYCPSCHAVYLNGRWQWKDKPREAKNIICSACHRKKDNYPAGTLLIKGSFLGDHIEQIINTIHNEEHRESSEHPMNKIINESYEENIITVDTTDIHLPVRIGKALKKSFGGKLKINYAENENRVHVNWNR